MSEIGSEPFRGLAKVRVENAALGNRNFTLSLVDVDPNAAGDEAHQDGTGATAWTQRPSGTGLTLRLEWNTEGATPPQQATIARVRIRLPGGDQVGATTWTPAIAGNSGSATRTCHFDDDPLNEAAGSLRWGAVELFFEVESVGGLTPWGPADSRGAFANPGTLTSDHARGYLRAEGVLSSHSLSNVALAGAEPATWAFPDPVHTRLTFAEQAFEAFSLTCSLLNQADTAERSETLSDAGTRDFSWNGTTGTNRRVGNGMTLASEAKHLRLTIAAVDFGGDDRFVLAAAGHEAGWTVDNARQITRSNRITVDPRLTPSYLLQLTDSQFGTPPMSKDVANGQRPQSEVGYVAARWVNARSEGQNGLSSTAKMWDAPEQSGTEASPVRSHTGTTATRGGEVGWHPKDATATLPIAWDVVLTGGNWTVKAVLGAGQDYSGLERNITRTLVLLAFDNKLVPFVSFSDGLATFTILDRSTGVRVVPDVGSAKFSVVRRNAASNRLEYLDSDGQTWQTWAPAGVIVDHVAAAHADDARLFTRAFSIAGEKAIVFGSATVKGVVYPEYAGAFL